jgi:hypothetical protein
MVAFWSVRVIPEACAGASARRRCGDRKSNRLELAYSPWRCCDVIPGGRVPDVVPVWARPSGRRDFLQDKGNLWSA